MNIPRTNSVIGSSPSVDSFQHITKKPDPAKAPAAGIVNGDAIVESPGGDSTHYGKRLRAYAEKIETRLKNALASPDLSRGQHEAIMKQSDKFQSLMKRLENAYLTDGGSALKNTHHDLDRIVSSINQTLGGAKSAGPQLAPPSMDVTGAQGAGGLDTLA